uniref:AraC-like ligand-binding domain-containing protein n=1 Tax=Actinacidiphila rubida TaxID=310780 RepID=UPI000849E3BC
MTTTLFRNDGRRGADGADGADRWQHAVSRAYVPMRVALKDPSSAEGSIASTRVGSLRVCRVEAGPQTVSGYRRPAQEAQPCVILTFQEQGTALKQQDGRESVVRPGEFSLTDSSRPFRKRLDTDFRFTSFCLPRDEVDLGQRELSELTATSFRREDSATAGLAADVLGRVAQDAAVLDGSAGRRLAATVVDLITLMIDELRRDARPGPPSSHAVALERLKQYALGRLHDPGLSPSRMAADNHMSVRYVHRLFESEGVTAAAWVRAQRLERCRGDAFA